MLKIKVFYAICSEVKKEWKSSEPIKEKHFIDILNFIKKNILAKQEVLEYFIKIMNGKIDMPLELIEFCMRELQWPEIKDLALKKLELNDPREKKAMEHILEIYESEWEDADLYQYYSSNNG